jgi:hypothetical protein
MIGRMACLLGRVDFIIFANKRQNVVRLFGRRSRPGGEVGPGAGGLPSELQGLPTASDAVEPDESLRVGRLGNKWTMTTYRTLARSLLATPLSASDPTIPSSRPQRNHDEISEPSLYTPSFLSKIKCCVDRLSRLPKSDIPLCPRSMGRETWVRRRAIQIDGSRCSRAPCQSLNFFKDLIGRLHGGYIAASSLPSR